MDTRIALELFGYLGSILVAISLMMKSLLRLRLINLVGATVFTLYGIFIGAYPVAFLNGIIVVIDLYYLIQMWQQKDYFSLLEVHPEDAYLQQFLVYHQSEINEFVPNFESKISSKDTALFILRNMVPAGLLIFHQNKESALIRLDFVIPGYRDFQIGNFLFEENAAYFKNLGITVITSPPGNEIHQLYLKRMGFKQSPNNTQFSRVINPTI